MLRTRLTGAALLVIVAAAGCGDGSAPEEAPAATTQSPGRQGQAQASGQAGTGAPASGQPGASGAAAKPVKHAFPLQGKGTYARTHHDYPASDIIANCGLVALSPVDGTVLEVAKTDTYDKKKNDGATRGGLSISILGNDGARYYMSHFASINAGVDPGVAVQAGQPLAKVGRTGDASACHIHFGLSPACQKTGDWFTRRGVIFPWPYLDAWKAGVEKSPVAELEAWQQKNGCPTKPTVFP